MGTKETIAVLGLTEKVEYPFLSKLAEHYRLLIVSDQGKDYTELIKPIDGNTSKSTIEFIDCAKDGCWEADIILLWDGFRQETKELQRLQAVATQKIILVLTVQEENTIPHSLFPHSKIINLFKNPITKEVQITGQDKEAIQTIADLIHKTEYYQQTESNI